MSARILLVEDNPANLELMSYLLKMYGHTLLTAADGEEGLRLARAEPADVVLLDLQLPGISGYEVLASLRDLPGMRDVPVVAVTAFAMVGDRENVLSAGFDGYLSKPIVPETFVEQVEGFLPPEKAGKPAMQADNAALVEQPRPEQRRRGVILVVDDSPTNLQLSRSMLEPLGFEVATAFNVEEGIAAARRRLPDLILTDVHLPDGTGLEILQAAKRDPDLWSIPVGLLSSSAPASQMERRALAAGAAMFVNRPIEPEELLRRIEDCLRRQRTR